MTELRIRLELRKAALWKLLAQFVLLRDAHGVHDMAVEIQGIELMLHEIPVETRRVFTPAALTGPGAADCTLCGRCWTHHHKNPAGSPFCDP